MSEEITLKEVFERLVQLEVKFDLSAKTDESTRGRFFWLAFTIIAFNVLGIIVTLYVSQ